MDSKKSLCLSIFVTMMIGVRTIRMINDESKLDYQALAHTVNNTANMLLIQFFQVSNNSLRNGFEPFYYITNLFIDNAFLPNIPSCKHEFYFFNYGLR